MNRLPSRIFLLLEAIGLILPLSYLLFVLYGLVLDNRSFAGENPLSILALLFAGAALIALWRIVAAGVISGTGHLVELHPLWFLLTTAAALWTLLAWMVCGLTLLSDEFAPLEQLLGDFVWGLFGAPAMIPYLHVMAERYVRDNRANGAS